MMAPFKRRTQAAAVSWFSLTVLFLLACQAFTWNTIIPAIKTRSATSLLMSTTGIAANDSSRRMLIQSIPFVAASGVSLIRPTPVMAATTGSDGKSSPPLETLLYSVLRVKEATVQESRLIQSGKFKDAQRANVKLAVKFMLNNYRLSDAVIAASAYIDDNNRRLAASDAGQAAVQNLYTILEYFDASDVANIKVGQDSMASKEPLVLKGLDSCRKNIDNFLSFFPQSTVNDARDLVLKENALNLKEWDPALGDVFNLPEVAV